MEGSALNRAYTASMEADECVQKGEFNKAKIFFIEAAEAFEEVLRDSPNTPSARILQALSKQHRDSAEYVQSERTQKLVKCAAGWTTDGANGRGTSGVDAQRRGSSSEDGIKGGGTSGGGMSGGGTSGEGTSGTSNSVNNEYLHGSVGDKASLPTAAVSNAAATAKHEDADTDITRVTQEVEACGISSYSQKSIAALFKHATTVFVRDFEHSLAPAAPSDSFYIATGTSSRTPAVTGTNLPRSVGGPRQERVEALEHAAKKMESTLNSGLKEILKEILQREQVIQEAHTTQVDRIRAENDQLHIQVKKMQERWDSLKEGARKRRMKQTTGSSAEAEP